MGSAPENIETMGNKRHNYRRTGSIDAIMAHSTEESKYQYHRKKSAVSMTFHRKGSLDSNTCYTMEDGSGKYRYPSSSFAKTFSRQNHHHRKTNVSLTSAPFEEQLGQQHHPNSEEVQPYFVSKDWKGGGTIEPTAAPANNVTDDSLLNLAGHHRNHTERHQQFLMLPPSPPASPRSHQNLHNDYLRIAEIFSRGDDNTEQQIQLQLSHTMAYNHHLNHESVYRT